MPSSSFKVMYIVLTYKHLNVPTDRVLDLVKEFVKDKYERLLCVEEHGTDGQHDHLNVCVEWKQPKYKADIEKCLTDAVYKKIQADYQPKMYKKDHRWKRADLHVGHMTKDKDKFWYLGKEKDHKILVNDNWGEPPKPPKTIVDKINDELKDFREEYSEHPEFKDAWEILTRPYHTFPGMPSMGHQFFTRMKKAMDIVCPEALQLFNAMKDIYAI